MIFHSTKCPILLHLTILQHILFLSLFFYLRDFHNTSYMCNSIPGLLSQWFSQHILIFYLCSSKRILLKTTDKDSQSSFIQFPLWLLWISRSTFGLTQWTDGSITVYLLVTGQTCLQNTEYSLISSLQFNRGTCPKISNFFYTTFLPDFFFFFFFFCICFRKYLMECK